MKQPEAEKLAYPPDAEKVSNYRDMDLSGYGSANRFGGFGGKQIALIIAENKRNNGGQLKSDASNDPYQDLVENDAKSEARPEVDHVIPKLSGGANHPLNARVVSWKLNNSEERNVHWSKKSWHK